MELVKKNPDGVSSTESCWKHKKKEKKGDMMRRQEYPKAKERRYARDNLANH